jgi:hypothetical protein
VRLATRNHIPTCRTTPGDVEVGCSPMSLVFRHRNGEGFSTTSLYRPWQTKLFTPCPVLKDRSLTDARRNMSSRCKRAEGSCVCVADQSFASALLLAYAFCSCLYSRGTVDNIYVPAEPPLLPRSVHSYVDLDMRCSVLSLKKPNHIRGHTIARLAVGPNVAALLQCSNLFGFGRKLNNIVMRVEGY